MAGSRPPDGVFGVINARNGAANGNPHIIVPDILRVSVEADAFVRAEDRRA